MAYNLVRCYLRLHVRTSPLELQLSTLFHLSNPHSANAGFLGNGTCVAMRYVLGKNVYMYFLFFKFCDFCNALSVWSV